jgi:hypothetical protein
MRRDFNILSKADIKIFIITHIDAVSFMMRGLPLREPIKSQKYI